jgi:predicted DsbA family dithiol-disulfide isomerase
MEIQNTNPLLCDYETGVCELPVLKSRKVERIVYNQKKKPVQIVYFTDPVCSACWGIEPQLRKLKLEYGDYINFEYHMGGLVPSWKGFSSRHITKPSDVAHHWDVVSEYYEMPIDGDVWLEDPLESSYPPSIAFIAAKIQEDGKAEKFLRRIREMVFIEKKNITKWEHLVQAALDTKLDIEKFKQDYDGETKKLFEVDLNFAKSKGVRGFPTLFFVNDAGKQERLYGYKSYDRFEQIILNLHPGAKKALIDNSAENILSHYPTLTTKEFSLITERTKEESEKILEGLVNRNIAEKVSTRNGPIWKMSNS